jgi:SulP family sulfate permease
VRGMADIYRKTPREFVLAVTTAATVVFVGVEEGIILALVLSLLQHVRHSYQPHTAVILHDAADDWRMEPVAPGRMIEPGLVMFWFGAELFYANAAHFTEQARLLAAQGPQAVRWLAVDCGAITNIDYSAAAELKQLQQDLAKQGVVLALSRVNADFRADLDRLELTDAIGADRLFSSRKACIAAYQAGG